MAQKLGGEKKVSDAQWKQNFVKIELTNIAKSLSAEIEMDIQNPGTKLRLLSLVDQMGKMIRELK